MRAKAISIISILALLAPFGVGATSITGKHGVEMLMESCIGQWNALPHNPDRVCIRVYDQYGNPTVGVDLLSGPDSIEAGVGEADGVTVINTQFLSCQCSYGLCVVNDESDMDWVPRKTGYDCSQLWVRPKDKLTGKPIRTIPFCQRIYPHPGIEHRCWQSGGERGEICFCEGGNCFNIFLDKLYIMPLPEEHYYTELFISYRVEAWQRDIAHLAQKTTGAGYTLINDFPVILGLKISDIQATARVWYRPYTCTKTGSLEATCTEGEPTYKDAETMSLAVKIADGAVGHHRVVPTGGILNGNTWESGPVMLASNSKVYDEVVYPLRINWGDKARLTPASAPEARYDVVFHASGQTVLPNAFTTCPVADQSVCHSYDYLAPFEAVVTHTVSIPLKYVVTSRGR